MTHNHTRIRTDEAPDKRILIPKGNGAETRSQQVEYQYIHEPVKMVEDAIAVKLGGKDTWTSKYRCGVLLHWQGLLAS